MDFKFLQKYQKNAIFQTEITNDIYGRGGVCWTSEYSNAIRRWVSDLFFKDLYRNVNYHLSYIQSIDRTCELMHTPVIINNQNHGSQLLVKVKLWVTNEKWLVAELSYPIEHVIYR